jgi:glycosyltransferase involved in cell wall biosynthesis
MMCKLPLLSICIPTYNRAELLKNCVESIVINYDFDEEVEVVISDNASDDNTLEICEMFASKYPNVK